MKLSHLILLGMAAGFGTVHAATLHVPADYPTIQAAIEASALVGDDILVAPGTYFENLDNLGKGIVLQSEAGPAATIIDGSQPRNPDSASVIFVHVGFVNIEGFTITGGTGMPFGFSNPPAIAGGGFCLLSAATIQGNWITENHVRASVQGSSGGAILIDTQASVRIIGNRIFSNSAGTEVSGSRGGAIYNRQGSVVIEDNVFYDNHAYNGAGGVIYDAPAGATTHTRNIYACNTAGNGPGVAFHFGLLRNCTVVSNEGKDAALYGFYTPYNSIIAFNVGGGISCAFGTATCNDVYGNTPFDVTGPCIVIGQNGNISVDPLFGDDDGCDASFCLDPDSPLLPEHSPPGCGLIGAQGVCEVLAIDAATDPSYASGPLTAYPNPLHRGTELRFVLQEPREVDLRIVDAQGRIVRRLLNQPLGRGQHNVQWDGRDEDGNHVASGAYIAVLRSPQARYSQKLLVIQ